MSDTNPNLPRIDLAEQGTFSSKVTASLVLAAITLGGSAMVAHYRIGELEKDAADRKVEVSKLSDRANASDVHTAHVDDALGHLVRAVDRLEDRLGTKPAHE